MFNYNDVSYMQEMVRTYVFHLQIKYNST